MGSACASAISDSSFVKKITDSNTLEVSLGEMARHQAASAEVRQFGQMMAKDHTLASNQLLEIAKKDNIPVSTDLDRAEYSPIRDLEGLKGRDFDRAYTKQAIEDHKKDAALFEQYVEDGANLDLRNYAEQNLPAMREHLRMARDILNKIEE